MAYYNYNGGFPPPYQPAYYGQQQMMQQAPQPQMQQQQPAQSQQSIVWVNGIEEANSFMIMPNNAVQLWDRNGKSVYVKSADATGMPQMRIYDLIERSQARQETAQASEEEKGINSRVSTLESRVVDLERNMEYFRRSTNNERTTETAE